MARIEDFAMLCPKCGGYLLGYAREDVGGDWLYRFRHNLEQETDCDGYYQLRRSQFEAYGVDVEDGRRLRPVEAED